MYGTIFTMKVKAGHEDQLLAVFNSREEPPAGGISWFLICLLYTSPSPRDRG